MHWDECHSCVLDNKACKGVRCYTFFGGPRLKKGKGAPTKERAVLHLGGRKKEESNRRLTAGRARKKTEEGRGRIKKGGG